ncbi:MAG: glycoside hydrolase family 2 [Herbinix sp.]|jgi:beta-galactosidase/beta-glucuronidase|nr:glycoside hydrolase family 2 [Herbinix sp.]
MLNAYPRPQFERDHWTNLNGEWNFSFDDNKVGEIQKWFHSFPKEMKIVVPYTYETKMSMIGDQTAHEVVWYNRKVTVHKKEHSRTILNFEGVDYTTKVWVNGQFVGMHQGGYAAFSFDVTDFITEGENDITVKAEDTLSCEQPRGKQRWRKDNFGCWYVQTTGIWKSVWMEEVPSFYLDKVKITPDLDRGEVHFLAKVTGGSRDTEKLLSCNILLEGKTVRKASVVVEEEYVSFSVALASEEDPWRVAVWEPGSPRLYDVNLVLSEGDSTKDTVTTYFGMRKISIEGNKVLLNNRPLYQRLILDQGYWEESHLTPPSEEAMIKDIELIMAAGYNGLRKHQKLEDRRFLYWCDKKGLLVWSEMAAQYTFHDDGMEAFTKEWMEVVEQNYNHPSIITWTPFNESWGVERIYTDVMQQKFTEAIYHLTKAFDPYRPVIVNDGWEHTVSDIITLHDYAERGEEIWNRYQDAEAILGNEIPFNKARYAFAKGYEYKGQPVIMSEYGGIAFTTEDGWGYGKQVQSEEDFLERFDSITSAIKKLDYICGFCYTQITDVQQEVNGLYTMKREPKVNIEAIKRMNEK